MAKESDKRKEVKRRFQLWIKPSALELAEKYRTESNCSSQSEFIEKAVIFYAGYLSAENNKSYLPNVVTSTLKGIVAESDNRQNRVLFKLAVEMAVMMNLSVCKTVIIKMDDELIKEINDLLNTLIINYEIIKVDKSKVLMAHENISNTVTLTVKTLPFLSKIFSCESLIS